MRNIKNGALPMDATAWINVGIKQEGASLMTPLGLIEGDVLNLIESNGAMILKDLVREMRWPETMVLMSVGALIRSGLIQAKRHSHFVYLVKNQRVHDLEPSMSEIIR